MTLENLFFLIAGMYDQKKLPFKNLIKSREYNVQNVNV